MTSPSSTREMVERLKALHAKATPGEWRTSATRGQLTGGVGLRGIASEAGGVARNIAWVSIPIPEFGGNLDFITAAHNDLPTLLDALTASMERERAAEKLAEALRKIDDETIGWKACAIARIALSEFESTRGKG